MTALLLAAAVLLIRHAWRRLAAADRTVRDALEDLEHKD
ncbi:hypothetical protein [Alloactinosynnema sp. L-07]|nr:hypothetical protein [Alloactinosynnema sp. L-07]